VPIEIPTPTAINEFFAREFPHAYADGHRCIESRPGYIVSRWSYDPQTLRPGGFISGPTQFALADTALFEITGATANAKVPALVRELFGLLDGLRRGNVTAEELAKARVRYRYETLASIDDAAAMAGWFGGTALYYPPMSLSQRLEAMEKVGVDDVVRVADAVLIPEHLVLAAVGTLSRARLGELRQVVNDWR
jgi:acyl-coenzyme A thioesterase PaaI-like protein